MTLREARVERKLRQEDVAELGGIDQGTVSALEAGRITNPTLATLVGLSKALELSIDDVVALLHPDVELVRSQVPLPFSQKAAAR